MKRPDLYASAFLTALAAAAAVGAYRLGLGDIHTPGSGFLPLATAALLGLMAAVQLAGQLLTAAARGPAQPVFARARWRPVLTVPGALAGFGFVLDRAGFVPSAFAMLAVLFGVVAGQRWWVALLAAALIAGLARVVFAALGVRLPEGPLGI